MQPRTRNKIGVALAAAVALLAAGWVLVLDDVVAAGRAHERGLARWEAADVASYSFVYAKCLGMCMECPQHITVRDGVVTAAVVRDSATRGTSGCGRPNPQYAPTIEDIFVIADERRPGLVPTRITTTVTYDQRWGFPTSIDVDCPDGYLDCGGGWSVRVFEVLR